LREAAHERPFRIMFEDEARFGRINNPRHCWAPYPVRPMVRTAIVQEFTICRSVSSLPPYSPELNPVEYLWDDIREKEFPNKVFGSMDMLELNLMNGLAKMENDPGRVKSIAGWSRIITVSLNAS
jgi:hypothetical protein